MADDPKQEVNVTPQLADGAIAEEKIEYRDENGVLLDEEQVKALEGKVSFSTRYETRTRLVDPQGNEIQDSGAVVEARDGVPDEDHSFAGTIADAPEPGTGQDAGAGKASTAPAQARVEGDLAKEQSIQNAQATAEPEAEAAGTETGSGHEL